MTKDLVELGRIRIDETKELVISEGSELIIISQYVETDSYKGFTKKSISIDKQNIESFIKQANRVIKKELEINIFPWGTSKKHDLIIQKVKKEKEDFKADKFDLRLYVNNLDYKGYTKKGLRLTRSVTKQLLSFLQKHIDTEKLYPRSVF